MKKILTMAAVAAMAFTACSKEEGGAAAGGSQVRITPTIANPALTPKGVAAKGVTRATDTDFELNDKVGLTITMTSDGSDFVANKPMIFDGKDFTTEGFLWYEDVNTTSTLFAYYPYQEGAAAPAEFSVKADQSGGNYTASDLIVAVKSGVKPTVDPTQMTFKHKMSRIVIDVTNGSGFDIESIVVKGAVGTGTLDPVTGTFTAKADAEPTDVTANTATPGKVYYALLVPQNGVKLEVTVTTSDGKKRTQTLGTTDLKSGENRRMDCNVQPAEIVVKFSGPITAWEDGEELLPEGEGQVEVPTVEWGGVKYKIVTLKDGRTWMAENLRYVPEGVTVSTDPTDGNAKMWAPYTSDGTTCTPVTDADEVAKLGYLYSFDLAFGAEITADNSGSFEGVQGICPDGWHIPTVAEWTGLVGKCNDASHTNTQAPYYDKDYDGAIVTELVKAGFGFPFVGARQQNNVTSAGLYMKTVYDGHLSVSYLMGSSLYKVQYSTSEPTTMTNIQYFTPMTTYTAPKYTEGRVNVGYGGFKYGMAVRCIKDK